MSDPTSIASIQRPNCGAELNICVVRISNVNGFLDNPVWGHSKRTSPLKCQFFTLPPSLVTAKDNRLSPFLGLFLTSLPPYPGDVLFEWPLNVRHIFNNHIRSYYMNQYRILPLPDASCKLMHYLSFA